MIEENESKDLFRSAELIQQRSDGLVEFMEHYKNFARLPDPVPVKVRVVNFYDSLIRFFQEDTGKQGITLEAGVEDPEQHIHVDLKLFEQAFFNLIRNSMDALQEMEGGSISLYAARKGKNRVSLTVSDDGPGVPPEILPEVFTPFFTTRKGGTGIGLSIVRKIVVMSGGAISLDPDPGKGTRVNILLPA